MEILVCLCDLGNIVLVVEYDEDVICVVDYIIDIGFGVGIYGGYVIVEGIYDEIFVNSEFFMG